MPWPGEIDPLPTVSDPDPFAARWAQLRAAELTRLATALEAEDPSEAYRIWVHTECLAPDSVAAARARGLLPGFVVARRPQPRFTAPPPRERGDEATEPPAVDAPETPPVGGEGEPAIGPPAVAVPEIPSSGGEGDPALQPPAVAAPEAPAAERDFVQFDAELAAAEESFVRARFRDVVQVTDRLRSDLDGLPAASGVRQRRVRIEVLGASALIALRLPDRAAEGFARALQVDPGLVLDPATTPPKVRRLFEEVRQAQQEDRP